MTDLKHEMLVELATIVDSIGAVPTQKQWRSLYKTFSLEKVSAEFGSFSAFLAAAGYSITSGSRGERRKQISEAFVRDLPSHLSAHQEMKTSWEVTRRNYPRTVICGDVHAPFTHFKALEEVYYITKQMKPSLIIQAGDARDMYSFGKFPRSHNVFTPKQELDEGTRVLKEFWAKLQEAAPKAECVALTGNHDARPHKRVLETCPELEILIDLTPYYTFDGVKTYMDATQEILIHEDVVALHGYRSKLGDHRDYMLKNAIVGHTHRGGVTYRKLVDKTIWEMNVGFVGDPTAKGLTYAPQKFVNWTLGVGLLHEHGPQFVAF